MEFDEMYCGRCGLPLKMEEMETIEGDFYCPGCAEIERALIKADELMIKRGQKPINWI